MAGWMLFAATAVVVVALIKLLEKTSREYAVFLSLAAVLLAVGAALASVQPVLDLIGELTGTGRLDAEWIQILLKTLGICLLCQITASVCRDAGENSLAFGVETVCRFTVLVEALPLLRELLDAVVHLLEGSL